jgi:hypothetical protein
MAPATRVEFADWKKQVDDQLRLLAGRSQIRPPQNTATSGDLLVGPSQALRVKASGGIADQFLIGYDGSQRVARFYRADGTIAFSTVAQTTIWDGAGSAVVGDDAGGAGLARPYIPVPWAPARTADWLATTNASFEDVWRMSPLKINPRATITIGHIADAATTGDVQVTINGSATGSPTAVATTVGSTTVGPFTLPGAQESTVELRVQGRRTGGAGSIRLAVLAATGFHS